MYLCKLVVTMNWLGKMAAPEQMRPWAPSFHLARDERMPIPWSGLGGKSFNSLQQAGATRTQTEGEFLALP